MIGKRFCGALLLALLAASVPSTATAASSQTATFAPRSHVVETAPLKKEARLQNPAFSNTCKLTTRTRGGASDTSTELVSAVALLAIDVAVRKLFEANSIEFPSQLGGCMILFVTLLLADVVKSGLGNDMFNFLTPGSAFLAKWLPVFFVPGLAMLPRAPSLGSASDIVKILAVVILGFLYTITTTVLAVSFVNKGKEVAESATPAATAAPSKPYSQDILKKLVTGSVISGAISVAATRTGNEFKTLLQTVFFLFSTLASYVWAARLPSDFTKVVHPLVTATAITWSLIRVMAELTGSNFMDVLGTYKVGSLEWKSTGAGDILLYMLGPAVVSFAISMYSRKTLLKENLPVVLTAMLVSAGGGLYGTAAFVRLLQIGGRGGGKLVRLSLIPRNVTTALAMAIASILGGDISITASVVVLTGIIGATYGRTILDAVGIEDPVARGLGIGASAQGLGVSSLVPEPDAFPFAAMSMVLTAVCATILVSIPAVRDQIVSIATGS